MKILFLDIDGVLNTFESRKKNTFRNVMAWIPENVIRLKNILLETHAKIVVSSDWRLPKYREHTAACLRAVSNLDKEWKRWMEPVGWTPDFSKNPRFFMKSEGIRGFECEVWRKTWQGEAIESWVAIDDIKYNFRSTDNLILTDDMVGLDDNKMWAAISKLGKFTH